MYDILKERMLISKERMVLSKERIFEFSVSYLKSK